jgi:hypothetical protein
MPLLPVAFDIELYEPPTKDHNLFLSQYGSLVDPNEHEEQHKSEEPTQPLLSRLSEPPPAHTTLNLPEYETVQTETLNGKSRFEVSLIIEHIPFPYKVRISLEVSHQISLVFKPFFQKDQPILEVDVIDPSDAECIIESEDGEAGNSALLTLMNEDALSENAFISLNIDENYSRNRVLRIITEALDINNEVVSRSITEPFCSATPINIDITPAYELDPPEGQECSVTRLMMRCPVVNPAFLLANWDIDFGGEQTQFLCDAVYDKENNPMTDRFVILIDVPPRNTSHEIVEVNISHKFIGNISLEFKYSPGTAIRAPLRFSVPEVLPKQLLSLLNYTFTANFIRTFLVERESPTALKIKLEALFVRVARQFLKKKNVQVEIKKGSKVLRYTEEPGAIVVPTRDAFKRTIAHYMASDKCISSLVLRLVFNHAQFDPYKKDIYSRSCLYWTEVNGLEENAKIIVSPMGYIVATKDKKDNRASLQPVKPAKETQAQDWNNLLVKRRHSMLPVATGSSRKRAIVI